MSISHRYASDSKDATTKANGAFFAPVDACVCCSHLLGGRGEATPELNTSVPVAHLVHITGSYSTSREVVPHHGTVLPGQFDLCPALNSLR